jgi:hypothetical protein
MKYVKLIGVFCASLFMLFGHNPANWHEDIADKNYSELNTVFGEPTHRCAEVGSCDIWVSGYSIFGIYIFPSLMVVSIERNKMEKTFVYLPIYSQGLHQLVSDLIVAEP